MNKSVSGHNQIESVHFLVELRTRLIYSLIVLFALFAGFAYYANELYTLLAMPLLRFIPQGQLIATQIVSPFFVPFKLAFLAALLTGAPFFLYQLWSFVAPALYKYEKHLVWPFLSLSVILFYAGIAFAYFLIFPLLFKFLAHVAPQGVTISPDINEYLDFTIKLAVIFGALFEIPIVMVLLIAAGLVTRARFIKMRSYAILVAFIIGMLLAPPDVLSQTILALPIWFLYEAGIGLSFLIGKKHEKKNEP